MRSEMGIPPQAKRLLTALTIGMLAFATAFLGPVAAQAQSHDEAAVISMVAQARGASGLAGLPVTSALGTIARRQSERMRAAGDIFHNPSLAHDLTAAGLRWTVAGENVGVGASVDSVENAFMNSHEHRSNILDRRFNAIGVSVVAADDGHVYVTQIFAQLVRTSPAPAATRVVGAHSMSERPACARTMLAEDGSRVPVSFYGLPC